MPAWSSSRAGSHGLPLAHWLPWSSFAPMVFLSLTGFHGESTSTIPTKRTRADAPSIPDKATVGEHCQGCGRSRL